MEPERRLNEYGDLLAQRVEVRVHTEEEKDQVRTAMALAMELEHEKGQIDLKELKGRFKAILEKKPEETQPKSSFLFRVKYSFSP